VCLITGLGYSSTAVQTIASTATRNSFIKCDISDIVVSVTDLFYMYAFHD